MNQGMLGQRLLQKKQITAAQLKEALAIQQKSGGKLGTILHRSGACNSLTLHEQLAAQQSLPFADLLLDPPDARLLDETSLGEYLFLEIVPWKQDEASGIITLATPQPDSPVQAWAQRHYPNRHCFAITSRLDIHRSLSQAFSGIFNQLSRERLLQLFPEQSARQTLHPRQRDCFFLMLGMLLASFLFYPTHSFVGMLLITSILCLFTLTFKSILFVRGMHYRNELQQAESAPINDTDCPIYTILVPLYREVESLPQIINAISALDYPVHQLDVKLVIEADDAETLAAAKALKPSGIFEIIEVPPSLPRTKPKACNYALRFARGEYLTIYDAEDKPDPQQLRRVLQRFRDAPSDVVCVQCRLNYYNRGHNLLTQLFSIEYASWFDFILPGLESFSLPIPLGGTSNHIALARLMELGEWDPYNVTEDADLGIRMAAAKYRTLTLDSLTMEEAPITLGMWMRQRSRWVKGYMQTWLVHMRRPIQLYRQLGGRAFWGFQFFIGGPCLVFLATPFLFLVSGYSAFIGFPFHHPLLPFASAVSLSAFCYGVLVHLAFACHLARSTDWVLKPSAIALFPFYWLLHSLASFKALWQLITRPHYWEKTDHGFTTSTKIVGSHQKPC